MCENENFVIAFHKEMKKLKTNSERANVTWTKKK